MYAYSAPVQNAMANLQIVVRGKVSHEWLHNINIYLLKDPKICQKTFKTRYGFVCSE